jgi:hypothetical protein
MPLWYSCWVVHVFMFFEYMHLALVTTGSEDLRALKLQKVC